MRYPKLVANIGAIADNARAVRELCAKRGVAVWGVVKGMSGDARLARMLADAGYDGIADSRVRNIAAMRDAEVSARMMLMRVAMPSELDDVVRCADVSMQSEVSTILRLDELALSIGRRHDVLLAVDIGDRREGVLPGDVARAAAELRGRLRGGVRVMGVATNFACASGVMPTPEKFRELCDCRDAASSALGQELPTVSIGGTCCLDMIDRLGSPDGVNQLRVGEAILLGTDTSGEADIPYLRRDTMTVEAEVVERVERPCAPDGVIGANAFGERVDLSGSGTTCRALLALGRQDCPPDKLVPLDRGVKIVTASSDHMIVDVGEAERLCGEQVRPGRVLRFRPLYPAMLACSTSQYVDKIFE